MALMHRRVLRGELARWYARPAPARAGRGAGGRNGRLVMPDGLAAPARLAWLAAAAALSAAAALAGGADGAAPDGRGRRGPPET